MFPPMKQCSVGHIVCHNCFYKMQQCIICGNPKSEIRAYALERLQAIFRFHCKYQKVGCNFFATPLLVQAHQNDCDYSRFVCPLGLSKCTWCDRLTVAHGQGQRPGKIRKGHLQPRFRRDFPRHRPN
nr:unnamed protein product [Callosobruchus chinensis]CAH7758471.1 unnamed protein product [Callosobruchus chinensis]